METTEEKSYVSTAQTTGEKSYTSMTQTTEDNSSVSMTRRQSTEKNEVLSSIPDEIPASNSVDQPQEPVEYLTGLKLFLVMFSITMAAFLMLLDASIVATAIPKITGQFHSLNDVGWYGTAYLLANCTIQPLTGKIYTHFNIKWTFLTFFGVFEFGSAICGAATSSNMLIIGRAISGLGASGLLNGSFTIIATVLPLVKQPSHRGILMGLSFFGLLGGPLIGGALTEYANWRWCFLINLPCGAAVALFLILITIPDYRVDKQTVLQRVGRLDLIGFCLFTPTVIMFILALQWGGTKFAWNSAKIIGLFCGAGSNLIVYLSWEHHMGDEAMTPLGLIKRRVIWSSCLNIAGFVGCAFTTTYYFPIWFQAVKGAGPTGSGVDMLPQVILNMVTTIVTGGLVQRVGYYLPFVLTSGVLTSIGTGLITTLSPTSSVGRRVGYQIIQGCQGLGFQIPLLAVQTNVKKEELAVATALVVFSQNLSGAVFLSLAQVIFSNQLRHELAIHAPDADVASVIIAGASASGVRHSVPASVLPGVILAYSKSFDHVMYLATGSAVGAFLFATCMGWVRIKKEEVPADTEKVDSDRAESA